MLNICKTAKEKAVSIALEGRLDTTTAPELERELKSALKGVTSLTLDMEKLEYISSAGLRILLSAQKTMNQQGEMKLIHAYAPETGRVTVGMEVTDHPASVRITFADCGIPYNPLSKGDPDVTLTAEERGIGGLGIYMTKKIMDNVAYDYCDGKNILTLKKNL